MLIALDYDDTFTRDTSLWLDLIFIAMQAGHDVVMVTARYAKHEAINDEPAAGTLFADGMRTVPILKIYYTNRQPKRKFMAEVHGIRPDVWIDDMPEMIGAGNFVAWDAA